MLRDHRTSPARAPHEGKPPPPKGKFTRLQAQEKVVRAAPRRARPPPRPVVRVTPSSLHCSLHSNPTGDPPAPSGLKGSPPRLGCRPAEARGQSQRGLTVQAPERRRGWRTPTRSLQAPHYGQDRAPRKPVCSARRSSASARAPVHEAPQRASPGDAGAARPPALFSPPRAPRLAPAPSPLGGGGGRAGGGRRPHLWRRA